MIPAAFRRVLAFPQARRLVLSSIAGRLPITFTSLATVLLVREHTGSYATAGLVAAAEAAGAGLATPAQGRLIDRHGQPRVLVPLALGNATALVLLAATAQVGAPAGVLVACALAAGACLPPIGPSMRVLWPSVLGEEGTLDAAYSFDAILTEVLFITGPVLATVLFAVASPAVALLVAGALAVGGTLAYARIGTVRAWRGREHAARRGWALSSGGVRTAVSAMAFIGVAFGALEVAMAAFARGEGSAAAAGLLLAATAAGSMAAGLWYGSRAWRGPLGTRLLVLCAALSAGLASLLLGGSIPMMGLLSVVAGLAIAPTTACVYRVVEDASPPGMLAESFTWLSTATVTGAGVGSAVTGPVVQGAGVRAGLAVPAAAALLCLGAALMGRGSLARSGAMVREA